MLAGSDKYEFAAKVATWQGAEPRRVADLLLRAAWCCVDEGDTEAERYFRRQAAWAFERALASYDGVERDERAVLTYLECLSKPPGRSGVAARHESRCPTSSRGGTRTLDPGAPKPLHWAARMGP
jgi:hypothetical protein